MVGKDINNRFNKAKNFFLPKFFYQKKGVFNVSFFMFCYLIFPSGI